MKRISDRLRRACLEVYREKGVPARESNDYRKWLRFYLDFCAKCEHPPRDHDSLQPFLVKLASNRTWPEAAKELIWQWVFPARTLTLVEGGVLSS